MVTFDFCGCGISEGKYISLGYYESLDTSEVIDYIQKHFKVEKIGIWGRSMGATTAILTAIKRTDIEFVLADSAFQDVK